MTSLFLIPGFLPLCLSITTSSLLTIWSLVLPLARASIPVDSKILNPNQVGGGRSAPRLEKPCIPLEPKVRLTSNQAENLSLWFVLRPI